jgi:hypothetical protein
MFLQDLADPLVFLNQSSQNQQQVVFLGFQVAFRKVRGGQRVNKFLGVVLDARGLRKKEGRCVQYALVL